MPSFLARRTITIITTFGLLALGGLAWATIFRIDTPAPRVSPKVHTITPDEMFGVCGFEKQDAPFFTDAEYRRAIAEYERQLGQLQPGDAASERLSGLRDGLKECRENDKNKRHAERAKKSCKSLVKEHAAAQESAWNAVETADGAFKREIVSWGERFRPALEKCLRQMRCRLDSKKDMQEALDVYREFSNELFYMPDFKRMKICGVTVRDLQRWCSAEIGENTTKDICTDPDLIRIALTQLGEYDLPPNFLGLDTGGAVGGHAP